jgi:hypothetical protein
MAKPTDLFIQFRDKLYSCFTKRADTLFDLQDALLQSEQVESPVAMSQLPAFRRNYPSIYDGLSAGRLDEAMAQKLLIESVPSTAQTISGYEVHVADATSVYRPEAETLNDRVLLKSDASEPARPGQAYSLLVRAVQAGSSWVAPESVQRIGSDQTASQVAGDQVRVLAKQNTQRKVIVGDSGYANAVFLAVFVLLQHVVALVRLRTNQSLYAAPPPYSGHGRPKKHGPRFKPSKPSWAADRECTIELLGQSVTLSAWHNLHFKKLAALSGLVLRVVFLRPDGTPRYKKPLMLFWTGPLDTHSALADVCCMYLWRFVIEHFFRFLKQHLGLTSARLTDLPATQLWVWLCVLAYAQLVLAAPCVIGVVPPWQRRNSNKVLPFSCTPRQVQRALPTLLDTVGTPAASPGPAGKSPGRPRGFQPKPRPRYSIIVKTKKQRKTSTQLNL